MPIHTLARRPLALALPSLLLAMAPAVAFADEASPTQLQEVRITGSRIPRASIEGPSPVTVISREQIDAQGYRNAFDALNALTENTGNVQGEDFGNTFTPAANTINLRGLGPNRTLVLVNGRRQADYPLAYDGSVNVVNLANIPSALIERIEVLAGGASAVYGSDAIAGVVNIILKDHYEGVGINVRAGGTEQGGGENHRVQVVGGGSGEQWQGVFGLELGNRKAIFASQRDFMDSLEDDPRGITPQATAVAYRRNASSGRYIDPVSAACGNIAGLYGDSVFLANNPRLGNYCGSNTAPATFWSVQTEKRNLDGYGSLTWHLDDRNDLFADFAVDSARIYNNTRAPTWTSSRTYFYNQNTAALETWYRRFAPEEIGGRQLNANRFLENSWSFNVGAKGLIGDSGWQYEAAYSRSRYENRTRRPVLLAGINDYLLGPQLGARNGVPVYAPDPARLYQGLTPQEYAQLSSTQESRNAAWLQTFSASVNGRLFALPGGDAALAAVVEAGSQGYRNVPDPQLGQGVFWNTSAGVPAGGDRDRYAAGVELQLPLLEKLTTTLAGRYDQYRAGGNHIGKATWSLGVEFRPFESLLLRGSAATSFRAPDMNYVFATETRGYNPGLTDYWRCRTANQAYANCDFNNLSIDFTSGANPQLQPETAKSYGLGLVWSPLSSVDVIVDYYDIRIDNEVTNLDSSRILRDEADCRIGRTLGGEARDLASPVCVDALARVIRNPSTAAVQPDQVTRVMINPINAASESVRGVDVKGNWRLDAGRYGRFTTRLAYSLVLSHDYRQFADDPLRDVRNSLDEFQWRSKANGSITWQYNAWTATIYGSRYGSLPKNDGSGRIAPYMTYNGSVYRQFGENLSVGVIVNNLRNSNPPADRNGGGWPYYPVGNYDPYGRQFWLEMDYRFR
ncbi:MAG: Vitamin B12 transporter BtuB [Stenotrophomonas maltophilia]|uniref:Vitamin B12 transporter BtuB n=1 Tax=Stenotrophomonas maltophilia TaxID=40324 RepID=A0A7V8JMY2_STEMA|nr:MAG: Vitamin B12 transporter BtuB [Stenotrophomonas maltophilia]